MQVFQRSNRLRSALRLVPLALAVAISALTVAHPGAPRVRLVPSAASGALALVDSRGGGAILTASGMHPGSSATGDISIMNASDVPAAVSLGESQLTSSAGLADSLNAEIQDLTTGRIVYLGALSTMRSVDAGTFAACTAHDFLLPSTSRATALHLSQIC